MDQSQFRAAIPDYHLQRFARSHLLHFSIEPGIPSYVPVVDSCWIPALCSMLPEKREDVGNLIYTSSVNLADKFERNCAETIKAADSLAEVRDNFARMLRQYLRKMQAYLRPVPKAENRCFSYCTAGGKIRGCPAGKSACHGQQDSGDE
ncbi:hypothetical protein BVRB_034630 [Beta vulgaris subsp. vulgaris]|uniref:Uncharacterized protein n=1 Tax=Beta vulgaris subsp. vulgaris TaxID=3555 RepID=A0A0J8BIU2_BETVV|nr:hypothetical protein BVRB_034630 [Beta vulgaris subsp. vulgaris]